jgi:outer membrane protein OmpA-like peptidoglycan-associated protein
MKKILITEEQLDYIIKNIRMINENEYDSNSDAPVWGKKKKGELKFNAYPAGNFAYFKNNGLFEDLDKDQILIISPNSTAIKVTTEDKGQTSVANISIKLELEDPFNFDKTTLTSSGEINYKYFLRRYNDIKEKYINIWDNYLRFIKENGGLEILGYASQDGNPNVNDGGKLEACSRYGVGIGLRSQYNQCLSQERANYIKDRLITDLPELNGLLRAKGMGETCEFGPCWSKNKKVTPKDTAKNRRFIINFPIFKENNPTDGINRKNNDKEINWDEVTTYADLSEFGVNEKYKAIQTTVGLKLEPGKIKELRKFFNNKIPVISAGQFNGQNIGEGFISENGIKIKSGDGETFFNEWKSSDEIIKNSKFEDKKFYRQTNWSLSILQSQDIVLRKYAIALYLM